MYNTIIIYVPFVYHVFNMGVQVSLRDIRTVVSGFYWPHPHITHCNHSCDSSIGES